MADLGLFVVSGHVTVTDQLLAQTRTDEAIWRELEWVATHYDEATDAQRAHLDRVLAAIDEMEDN